MGEIAGIDALIAELRAEREHAAALRQELATTEAVVRRLERALARVKGEELPEFDLPARGRRGSPAAKARLNAMVDALREHGPMEPRRIHAIVEAQIGKAAGTRVQIQDALRRNPETFHSLGNGRWTLTDEVRSEGRIAEDVRGLLKRSERER